MFAIRVIRFDSDFVMGLAIDFETASVLEFATATEIAFVQTLPPIQMPAAPSQPLRVCG